MRGNTIRRSISRFGDSESGSYAVEFAIISPLLIIMLMGTVELGLAMYTGSTVQYCVERVARNAMINATLTSTEIQNEVNAELASEGQNITVNVAYSVDKTGPVPIAQISTTYVYPLQIPLLTVYDLTFHVDTYIPQPAA